MSKKEQAVVHYCTDCAHLQENNSIYAYSIDGEKILGRCPYEEYAVLLALPCPNKHFKPKKP